MESHDSLLSLITFLPLATGLLLILASGVAGAIGGGSGLPVIVWRGVALASSLCAAGLISRSCSSAAWIFFSMSAARSIESS